MTTKTIYLAWCGFLKLHPKETAIHRISSTRAVHPPWLTFTRPSRSILVNHVLSSYVKRCRNDYDSSSEEHQSFHDTPFFSIHPKGINHVLPWAQIQQTNAMAIQRARDHIELPQRQQQGGMKRKASNMMLLPMLKKVASSSSVPSRVASAKSVRFSEFSTAVLLQPRSKGDRINSWYSRRELSAFKRSTTALADALKDTRTATAMRHVAGTIEHRSDPPVLRIHDKELIRGIEHVIAPEVSRHLLRMRRRAIHGVLQAQAQLDQERLAQAYRVNSVFAKEWTTLITNFQDA